MNESKLATLQQIREFLASTSDAAFAIPAEEPPYLKHRLVWRSTRPSAVPIRIRKAPAPQG